MCAARPSPLDWNAVSRTQKKGKKKKLVTLARHKDIGNFYIHSKITISCKTWNHKQDNKKHINYLWAVRMKRYWKRRLMDMKKCCASYTGLSESHFDNQLGSFTTGTTCDQGTSDKETDMSLLAWQLLRNQVNTAA